MPATLIGGAIDLASLKDSGETWNKAFTDAIAQVVATKAAAGVAPPVLVPCGQRVDLSGTFDLPDGFSLEAFGTGNFQTGARATNTDVRWSRGEPPAGGDPGDVPMFTISKNASYQAIKNLSIQANNGGTLFRTLNNSVLWTGLFRDNGFHGFHHLFGTDREKFLHTAADFDGRWNCNNARGTQFNIGGSDTPLAFSRFLHDVGGSATYRSEFAAANAYLIKLSSSQKMDMEGFYFTVEGDASGLLVANSRSDQLVTLTRSTIEGRNAGKPCKRDLIRQKGGTLDISRSRLNYGAKPWTQEWGAAVVVESGLMSMDTVWHSPQTVDTQRRAFVLVRAGAEFRGRNFSGPLGGPKPLIYAEKGAVVTLGDGSADVVSV